MGHENALEEFYAIGLRSPHRMTRDPLMDRVWIGDVGQNQREEIDVLTKGANFQWPILEGTRAVEEGQEPEDSLGEWTAPVHEYGRDDGRAVIGGYVYRGTRYPELAGKYVFGDIGSGNVFALSYEETEDGSLENVQRELLFESGFQNLENGITSFAVDAAGEIYILTLGAAANLHRLEQAPLVDDAAPQLLSETRLFADMASLEPSEHLRGYSVVQSLWSDGADKQRWMYLPAGEHIAVSEDGAFAFPEGAIFVKHFEFALDAGAPERKRRLETRVTVKTDDHLYGMTYKWREDGTDADLLTERLVEELEVLDGEGRPAAQSYMYPSPQDCLTCHTREAGSVLGVSMPQLVGDGDTRSHLEAWNKDGVFEPPAEAADAPFELSSLDDEDATLESRVRSYLHVNCAHCHGSVNLPRANWIAHADVSTEALLQIRTVQEYPEGNRLLVPCEPEKSILFRRVSEHGGRMPPLGTLELDQAFLEVLRAWLEGPLCESAREG